MSMPIGWTAEDWEERKRKLWRARNTDTKTITRQAFVIAEHVRTGSIINLENEYGVAESEIYLWINGLDKYENENESWFMRDGGQAALQKLDRAFKEATK